jgi:hypothetical protein
VDYDLLAVLAKLEDVLMRVSIEINHDSPVAPYLGHVVEMKSG